ncbi:uncharacterized protein LOC111387044, partial [Olea europaea var. sylvestris]|uniref:uncharacterized protein LOC111387044 n=1 Tax=Olea europaea var. sylvestris TaxID=158386 RepID=UPI000C1D69F6
MLERFSKAILQIGYKQTHATYILFYKHENGKSTILIVCVDDIITTGGNISEIDSLKKKLADEFEIKDLGTLRYFLGMEIARNGSALSWTRVDNKALLANLFTYLTLDQKLLYVSTWRSISGYCSYVYGNLVTWKCKMKNIVARCTVEAKLRSMANG